MHTTNKPPFRGVTIANPLDTSLSMTMLQATMWVSFLTGDRPCEVWDACHDTVTDQETWVCALEELAGASNDRSVSQLACEELALKIVRHPSWTTLLLAFQHFMDGALQPAATHSYVLWFMTWLGLEGKRILALIPHSSEQGLADLAKKVVAMHPWKVDILLRASQPVLCELVNALDNLLTTNQEN